MLKRILLGAPEEAPHFWLIYVIIWLYVLTPFFRYVVQRYSGFCFKRACGCDSDFPDPWNLLGYALL